MIDQYSRLLRSVAQLEDASQAETAVKKLVAHLKSSGRAKMLPQILRELRTIMARRAALAPRVEVAHKKDAARALKAAKAAGIEAEEARVNASLVSGWRAIGGGKLVDRSGKSALAGIYKKITA